MKMYLRNIVLSILALTSFSAKSQDIQFSQFYNVPLYMNPGFAGSLHRTRVSFHQRLQWPKLDAKYTTSVLSADGYLSNYKSGVGLMVMQDNQGGGQISSTEAHFMYSYEVNLNKKFTFKPGLEIAYVSRFLNYAELRFPHQFNNTQGLVGGSDPQDIINRAKAYADLSAGGILYTKEFWAGFAAHHINTPNQSFDGGANVSTLPTQYSIVSGHKFVVYQRVSMQHDKEEASITPTFQYKWQGKSDQLDLGLYGAVNEFLVGFWYRGIPIKRYENRIQNNESIIGFIGWKGETLRIGYSYDLTISRLARAGTGGSHEFNVTYVFPKKSKKKKIMKRLPCPSF